jgi:hypothetical protein
MRENSLNTVLHAIYQSVYSLFTTEKAPTPERDHDIVDEMEDTLEVSLAELR